MPESKAPTSPHNSKSGRKAHTIRGKTKNMTKYELEHALKIQLMRDCMVYGKTYEACILYFESKGFTLGRTQFSILRQEIRSNKNAKEWFSKEALFVIEEDHMLSVERIRMMEDRLLQEFEQVAATNFYKYVNAGTTEQELIRNKSHDANLLLRIIAQFQSLQETKTKMFSATPMVQELMTVHRQQKEEEEMGMYNKTEKNVTMT